MSASEILPAPEIAMPVPSKFERERWAFYKQLSELLKAYEGEYVAIHEGRVVGHGADQAEVALDAYNRFGYVPMYVGHVTSEPPRPARIPSPRLVQAPGAWNGPISVQYSD
jgi:hypothetical protein